MAQKPAAGVAGLIRSGKLREAQALLDGRRGFDDLLERARLALRLGDFAGAERLASDALSSETPKRGYFVALAVRETARAGLGYAETTAIDLGNVPTADFSQTIYYLASAACIRNEFMAVEVLLTAHAPKEPATRAAYLLLRGYAAAGRGDVAKQLELSDAAIKLLRREAPDEAYYLAQAAYIVALLVRELPCKGFGDALQALERDIEWPDELHMHRFWVLRALGWKNALVGDFESAMTYLLRAAFFTGDPLLRIYAHLDRATVSVFAAERASARAEFLAAVEIVDATQWESVHTEAIAVLPFAAQLAAELGELECARRLCDLALRLQPQIDPQWALAHGDRFTAFVNESVAFAYWENERTRAEAAGEAAYVTFGRLGYAWRAGRVAALLAGGAQGDLWHDRATRWLSYYGNSPLLRLLRPSRLPVLSPRQREVHRLMAQGKTGNQIAAELGISTFTVRNHERLVMRAFGVHRRVELLDKAR